MRSTIGDFRFGNSGISPFTTSMMPPAEPRHQPLGTYIRSSWHIWIGKLPQVYVLREEHRFGSRAACPVATSDSWPLIEVEPSADARLGLLSDPTLVWRCRLRLAHEPMHRSESLCVPTRCRPLSRGVAGPQEPSSQLSEPINAGFCKRTSENLPSETVWKIRYRSRIGATKAIKRGRKNLDRPPLVTREVLSRCLRLFSKQFLHALRE